MHLPPNTPAAGPGPYYQHPFRQDVPDHGGVNRAAAAQGMGSDRHGAAKEPDPRAMPPLALYYTILQTSPPSPRTRCQIGHRFDEDLPTQQPGPIPLIGMMRDSGGATFLPSLEQPSTTGRAAAPGSAQHSARPWKM